MQKGLGIGAMLAAGLCAAAGCAHACERRDVVPGHWEWQGNGHVWVPEWRGGASVVRGQAHDADKRDADAQPRDLDHRFARGEPPLQLRNQVR